MVLYNVWCIVLYNVCMMLSNFDVSVTCTQKYPRVNLVSLRFRFYVDIYNENNRRREITRRRGLCKSYVKKKIEKLRVHTRYYVKHIALYIRCVSLRIITWADLRKRQNNTERV